MSKTTVVTLFERICIVFCVCMHVRVCLCISVRKRKNATKTMLPRRKKELERTERWKVKRNRSYSTTKRTHTHTHTHLEPCWQTYTYFNKIVHFPCLSAALLCGYTVHSAAFLCVCVCVCVCVLFVWGTLHPEVLPCTPDTYKHNLCTIYHRIQHINQR